MAYVANELFRQEFTDSSRIIVEHNQDVEYPAVRLIVDNVFRPDLILAILVDEENPTNRLIVNLRSVQSGVIQILDYDFQPVGVQSADLLALLDQGQRLNFGDEYTYVEDLAADSTTSATFVQRLRLTTGSVPLGIYRVGVSFTANVDDTGESAQARLQVDDSEVIWSVFAETKDAGTDQEISVFGWATIGLLPGVHTVDLDYAITGGATLRITNPRIEFWRV